MKVIYVKVSGNCLKNTLEVQLPTISFFYYLEIKNMHIRKFLKDHVTVKTDVMAADYSALLFKSL